MEIGDIRLQKLLFYVVAYYCAEQDKRWLIRETFEAWGGGPICPPVYSAYKKRRTGTPNSYDHRMLLPIEQRALIEEEIRLNLNGPAMAIVDRVLRHFGKIERFQLAEKTHVDDGPWAAAWQNGRNSPISQEEIYEYFKKNPLPP